ncbi:MAG: hypothetical protein R3F10_03975 [Lysobacteraceae bacterium]
MGRYVVGGWQRIDHIAIQREYLATEVHSHGRSGEQAGSNIKRTGSFVNAEQAIDGEPAVILIEARRAEAIFRLDCLPHGLRKGGHRHHAHRHGDEC